MTATFNIPGKPPTNNSRQHWRMRQATAKRWRTSTSMTARRISWLPGCMHEPERRLSIRLVRVYAGNSRPLGRTNLPSAFKAVIDGLCDTLWAGCKRHKAGCGAHHDDDPRLTYDFAQERGDRDAVRVEVEATS